MTNLHNDVVGTLIEPGQMIVFGSTNGKVNLGQVHKVNKKMIRIKYKGQIWYKNDNGAWDTTEGDVFSNKFPNQILVLEDAPDAVEENDSGDGATD